MATNDRFEGDNDGFMGRFARTSIGIGAVGAGGYKLWSSRRSNRPVRSVADLWRSADRSATNLGNVLRDVGAGVADSARQNLRADQELAADLMAQINQSDFLSKISGTVEETTALLNSVLNTLDDPTTGLDDVLNPSIRDDIVNLASRLSSISDPSALRDELQDLVGGFVSSLAGGPEKNRVIWARHLRESRGLAQELVAPARVQGTKVDVHRSFASMDEFYSSMHLSPQHRARVENRVKVLDEALSRLHASGSYEPVRVNGQHYLQISRGNEVINYPVWLGDREGPSSALTKRPPSYSTSPGFSSEWRMPRGAINSEILEQVQSQARVPLHSIPGMLSNQERSLLGSVRAGIQGAADPLEHVRKGIHGNDQFRRLHRMAPSQWLDYLKSTAALAVEDLPTLSTAVMSTEEMLQNAILGRLRESKSFGGVQFRHLREELQSLGITNHVMGGDTGVMDTTLQRAINSAHAFDQNYVKVVGLENRSSVFRQQVIRELAANPYMDPSASPGRIIKTLRGRGGRMSSITADVGLYAGSPLSQVRFSGSSAFMDAAGARNIDGLAMRAFVPKTARLEQIVGRPRAFASGSVANHGVQYGAAPAIGWTEALQGTTNKAFIMVGDGGDIEDTAQAFFKKLDGTGQVYHSGVETLIEQETHRVLEPKQNRRMMGRLLEAVNNGITELTHKDGAYYAGDQRLGSLLGYDERGMPVRVRTDPDTIGAKFALRKIKKTNRRGVDTEVVQIVMSKKRRMPAWKGFSNMHKGMFQNVARETQRNDLERLGAGGLVRALGVPEEHLAYGAADTITKSHLFWNMQIDSAFEMLGGDREKLSKRAGEYIQGKAKFSHTGKRRVAGSAHEVMESVTAAFMDLAPSTPLGSQNRALIGHALAGLRSASYKASTEERESLNALLTHGALGKEADFLSALNSRIFYGAAAVAAGEGPGDYGAARASLDKRQAAIMTSRLKNMGLDNGVVTDIMTDVASRMEFAEESATSAKGLLEIAREARGIGRSSSVLQAEQRNATILSLTDLVEALDTEDMGDFLRRQQGVVKVDFTAAGKDASDTQISRAAGRVLGHEPITLPTGSLMEALEGTMIKDGDQMRKVSGEFLGSLGQLLGSLRGYMGSPVVQVENAEALESSFRTWQEDVVQLAAKSHVQSLSGKLSGSTMVPLMSYDMSELGGVKGFSEAAFGLKSSQVDWIKRAQGVSHGRAIFMDDQAFLGLIRSHNDPADIAKRAEMFFMGGYKNADRLQGITAMAVRQPVLGSGHVAPVQIFRHLGNEAGDDLLRKFQESTGRWSNISSWGDLAKQGDNTKRAFFSDFTSLLSKFAGEGGGNVYAPRMLRTTETSWGPQLVDYGIQAAMGADNDGDHLAVILSRSRHANAMMSGMTAENFLSMDKTFKEAWHAYGEVSKRSMKAMAAKPQFRLEAGLLGQLQAMGEDTIKESMSKTATGPVDVQLNTLRIAAMDMAMTETGDIAVQASRLSGLLAAVQEHTTIKGKRSPIAYPFADYLTASVKRAMEDGGNTAPLRAVMEHTIFGEWQGDVSVGGTTVNLSSDLDLLDRVVQHAKSSEWNIDISAGSLASRLSGPDAAETFASLRSGAGVTGAYVRGFGGGGVDVAMDTASSVVSRFTSAMGRMDLGAGTYAGLGIMAGGIMASMFAPSYAPTPLTTTLDRPSQPVGDRIASGSALTPTPSSHSLSPPSDAYAMMGRSINERAAYMDRPNAFQVRGTVTSRADLDNVMSVVRLGPMGGGHVTLGWNDNRRPITQNYIDRMMGSY